MKISAKTDYALRAMLELALEYEKGGALNIQEIAKKQDIPKRFLEHLLLNLKNLNLVVSYRGKAGGYKLAKKPENIKIGAIIKAIEGSVNMTPQTKIGVKKDIVADVWRSIQSALEVVLDSITLEDLVAKKQNSEKTLTYYI